jgi:hypothetical protein
VRTESKDGTAPLPVCLNGQALPGQATGKWTRYLVTRTGNQVECRPEGASPETVKPLTVPAGPLEISLKSGQPLRVASVYLKALP